MGSFKRILALFARPEPPPRQAPLARVATPAAEVPNLRRQRAKEIKACYLHFDGIDIKGMVLHLSHDGADIRLPYHLDRLPDRFTLKFQRGESHACRIRWRDGSKIGVAFV